MTTTQLLKLVQKLVRLFRVRMFPRSPIVRHWPVLLFFLCAVGSAQAPMPLHTAIVTVNDAPDKLPSFTRPIKSDELAQHPDDMSWKPLISLISPNDVKPEPKLKWEPLPVHLVEQVSTDPVSVPLPQLDDTALASTISTDGTPISLDFGGGLIDGPGLSFQPEAETASSATTSGFDVIPAASVAGTPGVPIRTPVSPGVGGGSGTSIPEPTCLCIGIVSIIAIHKFRR